MGSVDVVARTKIVGDTVYWDVRPVDESRQLVGILIDASTGRPWRSYQVGVSYTAGNPEK
jgi:hypothetical protein